MRSCEEPQFMRSQVMLRGPCRLNGTMQLLNVPPRQRADVSVWCLKLDRVNIQNHMAVRKCGSVYLAQRASMLSVPFNYIRVPVKSDGNWQINEFENTVISAEDPAKK